MTKVKTIEVKAFRGLRDTIIDFNGKSIIIHGENGTGKSSLVDAFEFLFKGKIQHLDEVKATSTKRHAPHILFPPRDTMVKIVTQNPECFITRTFKELTLEKSKSLPYYDNGTTSNFILHRKQLLDFIITNPAGRYEQIARIIGVGDLDEIELNFLRQKGKSEEEIVSLDYRILDAENVLKNQLSIDDSKEPTILNALNEQLVLAGLAPLGKLSDCEKHRIKVISGTKDPEEIKLANNIEEQLKLIKQFKEEEIIFLKHKELWERIIKLQKDKETIKDLFFHQLISYGQEVLLGYKSQVCPLCEQEINYDKLIERLQIRLKSMEDAQEKSEKIIELKGKFSGNLTTLIQKVNKFEVDLLEIFKDLDVSPLKQYIKYLTKIQTTISLEPIKVKVPTISDILSSPELIQWQEFITRTENLLTSEKANFKVSVKDQKALEIIDLLSGVSRYLKNFSSLNALKETKGNVLFFIVTAYNQLKNSKQKEIQNIYNAIQEDMQRYYDTLHPGEQHREIRLRIDPQKRSSTEILIGFHDRKDEDPRAYQSEAHLDSLGLCTFLAFVKNFNKDFSLVILDDVVGTIDTQHRKLVCALILQEFKDHQLLITTHDIIWFDELVSHQRAFGLEGNFTNLCILDWSLSDGIRFDYHKSRWEVLDQRIKDNDKVSSAAHARRNLEWILLQMALTTKTKIPIKLNRKFFVSDLYDPFKKRINKLIPDIISKNENIFIQLETNNLFGNLLIHNNIEAENISIEEIKSFAKSVKDFFDLFTCEKEQFINYHQSAKVMKCKCNHKVWKTK